MKRLILMQGAPGSGKSTVAEALAHRHSGGNQAPQILSTDRFHYRQGIYEFNPAMVGKYHAWTQALCLAAMIVETPLIIIDNTNIKREHVQPYLDMAEEHGYTVTVVRVDPGLVECLARNAARSGDRRIPEDVIVRMYRDMETLLPETEEVGCLASADGNSIASSVE